MGDMDEIISINKQLRMNLDIPDYQRPYKWTIKNIDDLLSDIKDAIDDSKRYREGLSTMVATLLS